MSEHRTSVLIAQSLPAAPDIPAELHGYRQFVSWRLEDRPGQI